MMLIKIPEFLLSLGYENYMKLLGIIILLWAVMMIILERFYPYTDGVKLFRKGAWIDFVWYTIIQSKILEVLIFTYIILNLKTSLGLANFGPLSHLNFWLVLFIFFITHDFYIYWFHRLQHNNRWLWRTHEAHHSNRQIDYLAGSRSHPLEILINQTIEFLPIFFFLDSETAAYMYPAKAMIDATWGMWIHANVNVNSGKLQYILNGPEMHQWHHANHHEVFYKNYSTKLAIWDWLFGTGFLPNLKPMSFYSQKPKMFGLPYAYPQGYFTQLIYAVWRFDFRYFEEKTIYKAFIEFKKKIIYSILGALKVKKMWVETELFDAKNHQFRLDESNHMCQKCKSVKKYFYEKNELKYFCEHCEVDLDLEKFN